MAFTGGEKMCKVISQSTCLKIFQEEQSTVFLLGREGLFFFSQSFYCQYVFLIEGK